MKHIDDLNEGIKYSRYGHLSPIDKSYVSQVEVELSPVERHLIPSQLQKGIDHQFQLIGSSFGFQTESIKNMKEFFCSLVLSRLPRYAHCTDCLDSLFEDVLGKKSNFRIWSEQSRYGIPEVNDDMDKKLECLIKYYLIWGEAANLRFCPELICFITALALQADPPEWIPGDFLERIVVPLYSFLRDELYKLKDGYWVRKNRDHSEIVGYDDVNEAFWLVKNIEQLKTTSGKFIMKEPEKTRFQLLSEVEWKSFLSNRKSFFEKRNGYHVIVNFIQIWLIHLFFFFYMTMASGYSLFDDPVIVINLGGLLMSAVATISLLFEASFLPYGEIYRTILPSFITGLFVSLLCAAAPASCFLLNLDEKLRVIVSWAGAAIGFIVSLSVAFVFPRFRRAQKPLQLRASFHRLIGERKLFSLSFWVIIFALKLAVSFLYLISPFVQLLGSLKPLNIALLQEDVVTEGFRLFVVTSFVALNFVLFLLDTYIWFTIVMSISGTMHSLFSGISAFRTQVFMNLPQRIKTKLRVGILQNEEYGVAKLWNSIVLSLYNDHQIAKEGLKHLLYSCEENGEINSPKFFVKHEDLSGSDASLESRPGDANLITEEGLRRLKYFANSLSLAIPDPLEYHKVPNVTVLIPHYSEKILLSTKELISEYDGEKSNITVLDYLKLLYPEEWNNFLGQFHPQDSGVVSIGTIGFSSHSEQMKTRVWASLRSQTLFRTISGFYNYFLSRKLFCMVQSLRRVQILIAMQKYDDFDRKQLEDVEFLLKCFPEIEICYISKREDGKYFSCFIDSSCEKHSGTLKRKPKHMIMLPGMPVLGDGKSDNQNCALPYTRGEILQLIDANQDCYFEESLKLPNLYNEFFGEKNDYVAIVGTREFIFSERIGALGDNAAAKEYTFGTICQRVSCMLGSRLHYGHPDFLSSVFMLTRGGVSKGQKSLHLNEDIYAGIQALCRNAVIKHSEYYQCGKGRDVGLMSILSFVFKIGSGMGEQALSREQYYLGQFLPLDRLLSFFYFHPGFHVNNLLCVVAINMFAIELLCFEIIGAEGSYRWFNQAVVSMFVVMFVSYIPLFLQTFTEFGISAAAKRIGKQLISLTFCFEIFTTHAYAFSVSSIGWSLGGTGYISSGRGFATNRIPFSKLMSTFKSSIVNGYFVLGLLIALASTSYNYVLCLLFLALISFSLILSPFLFNPNQFINSECMMDYGSTIRYLFLPSRKKDSWTKHQQDRRMRLTGNYSFKGVKYSKSNKFVLVMFEVGFPVVTLAVYQFIYIYATNSVSKNNVNELLPEIAFKFFPVLIAVVYLLITLTITICIHVCFSCIIGNILLFGYFPRTISSTSCILNRVLSVIIMTSFVSVLFLVSNRNWPHFVIGLLAFLQFHVCATNFIHIIIIGKEFKSDVLNRCWWEGSWFRSREISTCWTFVAFFREWIVKTCENVKFPFDFWCVHITNFSFTLFMLIPKLNDYHSLMLFWTKPRGDFMLAQKVFTSKQKRKRKSEILKNSLMYVLMLIVFVVLIVLLHILPVVSTE